VFNDFSIVVGDKSAHQMNFHPAQILYTILFIFIWNAPSLILGPSGKLLELKTWNLIKCLKNVKFSDIFLLGTFLPIIVASSVNKVHPYLLADNRHIAFYLWNKILAYEKCQYMMIPVYFLIFQLIKHNFSFNHGFPMIYMYFFFTILAVCPQLLLEIRYFMVPNLFYQLYSNVSNFRITVIYNLLIASIMLYICE